MGMIQFEIICFHPDRVHEFVRLSVRLFVRKAFVENDFLVSLGTKFIRIDQTVEDE